MEISKKNNFFYVKDITVRFGGLTALKNISINIEQNEIRGLIGPNGAGKTTFFNVATGFIPPVSGNTFFKGENISHLKPDKISKLGIMRTFQKRGIVPNLTALENVMMGYHRLMDDVKIWHIGFRSRKSKFEETQAIQRANETLDSLKIIEVSEQRAGDLSFGQQTLIEIARAIVSKPKLLLLDEPAAGLSSSEREHLMEVLKMLNNEQKVSLIIADHVMDFMMEMCEKITVLNFGEILAEGSATYVRQHRGVIEAYLGGGD